MFGMTLGWILALRIEGVLGLLLAIVRGCGGIKSFMIHLSDRSRVDIEVHRLPPNSRWVCVNTDDASRGLLVLLIAVGTSKTLNIRINIVD
ncbi:hypothetical protein TSUD_95260 [Trifolium subterraneum]|uniref:Uncharacterized protein n=1 Tax=Trifolium subterraneum TaxID=3900 RepID=A0A2Z6LTT6_TRISU|nr:hypothetical protein TSUD_95260 [Trifolium subterraneum]